MLSEKIASGVQIRVVTDQKFAPPGGDCKQTAIATTDPKWQTQFCPFLDVPWKRVAISADMYAATLDTFPPDWESSLAVYAYEPAPDPLDTTGEVTTFLKVVASITGLVWSPIISLNLEGILVPNSKFTLLNKFFAAFSALVQVGVVPSGERKDGKPWQNLADYPYFSDFEPKKREVIEPVSSTGEILTSNAPDLKVTKSTTSTPSTEMEATTFTFDKNTGVNAPTTIRTFGAGTAVTTEVTDASRERRETQSYTTNLSHVYQTLDSYHAGTNRAMFLVSPRPHLVDSVYTFVNGPRRLEGIQEFFLVVRRPKEMTGICVKATLDTAHLDIDNPDSITVFMTSRAVSGCTAGGAFQIGPPGTWVVSETATNKTVAELLAAAGESGPDAVGAANTLGRIVRDETIKSLSAGVRFPDGAVHIEHTQFGLRHIVDAIPQTALQDEPKLRASVAQIAASLQKAPSMERTLQGLKARTDFLSVFGISTISSKSHEKTPNQEPPVAAAEEGIYLPEAKSRKRPEKK